MNNFKIIRLNGDNPQNINTELYFELASARADGCEVVRLDFESNQEKIIAALKKMKNNSAIQFFATSESFSSSDTEAVFLLNKYPDIREFENNSLPYIYVKL